MARLFVKQYKFNTEIAPDKEELQRMSKKNLRKALENMPKDGATRPLRSGPNLQIKNMLPSFLQPYPTYYDHLIGQASTFFVNLVQTGEMTEGDLKSKKNNEYQILAEQASGSTKGSTKKHSRANE